MEYFFNYDYFRINEADDNKGLKASLNNNIGNNVSNVDNTKIADAPINTAGTDGTSGTNIIESTDETSLNNKIQEWNTLYSQAFKFQNDMPKDVNSKVDLTNIGQKNPNNDTQITDYNNSLLAKVRDGIIKIAELLTSKNGDSFMFKGRTINIVGHTSSPAKPEYNIILAKRRSDFVINAIKSAMNTILKNSAKPEDIVSFVSAPKGETELIIRNDTQSGDAILNTNNKEIEGSIDVKQYQTPEQKQGLNRRVVIGLDKFPIRYNQPEKEIISSSTDIPIINPTDVKFNTDSYILTSKSDSILTNFANEILEAIKNNSNLTDIYICSHSHKAKEEDPNDIIDQENKIFYISLNRAVSVKNFLQNRGIKIKYHLIPCSYLIPKGNSADENKRVEIYFNENNDVKKAKNAFNQLSKKYGIENNNGEYDADRILTNKVLRKDIITNIIACMKEGVKEKWIPLELWYDEYGTNEDNLKAYKKELENTVSKYGKNKYSVEDFVYIKR